MTRTLSPHHAVVLLFALLPIATLHADSPRPAGPLDARALDRDRLLHHIRFLASDELEGRDTATRGDAIAARYIAVHFERFGLTPAVPGAEGGASYYQEFRLDTTTLEKVELAIDGRVFHVGGDFAAFPFGGSGEVEADIVFCGYGITAPEFEYDDYAGIDVAGKIALVLRHEPLEKTAGRWFAGRRHSRHALFATKYKNALDHGAAGLILINDPVHCAKNGHFGDAGRSVNGLLDDRRPSGGESAPGIAAIFAGRTVADFLDAKLELAAAQRGIDERRKPSSRPTGIRATLRVVRRAEVATTRNVAAVLPGSDPQLADEYVIIGGHLDHEGIQNGQVMNGANDNASGTAAVLMLAEILAAQPTPPRRSVLFLLFNAEEKGLLGSRHYVADPLVPLSSTVTMINLDMVGRSKGRIVNVSGGAHSRLLDEISRRALKEAGIDRPAMGGLRINARSDHFPFFDKGIPILTFHSDDMADYHRPTDDVDKITIEPMERIVRAVATTLWDVANADERPRRRKLSSF